MKNFRLDLLAMPILITFMWACVIIAMTTASSFASNATSETQAFELTRADVEAAIAQTLEDDEVADKVKISITSTKKKVLYKHHLPLDVSIKNLEYDNSSNKWSANLLIMNASEALSATAISGRFESMQLIPTLTKRFYEGEIISEKDIEMIAIAASKIRKNTITNRDNLIGLSPKRVITNGRPIRISELEKPAIISKGDTVYIRYKSGAINISTIGEALENAAIGDSIRVKNKSSGIAISAVVNGRGEVEIRTSNKQLAMNN